MNHFFSKTDNISYVMIEHNNVISHRSNKNETEYIEKIEYGAFTSVCSGAIMSMVLVYILNTFEQLVI